MNIKTSNHQKKPIYFITEGATERRVGLVLYQRKILSQLAYPVPLVKHSLCQLGEPEPRIKVRREGFNQIIKLLGDEEGILEVIKGLQPSSQEGSQGPPRVLLVFDQENASTPVERAKEIGSHLNLSFNPIIDECKNLFEYKSERLHVVLHISSINNMFEGYILELLNGPDRLLIAQDLARSDIDLSKLFDKAEREFTELMEKNGFPWIDAKARLYAYITAFQFRGSHADFAEAVVRAATDRELRRIFDCLIKAWERLCRP